jgi:hypothetical protein
MFFIIQTIQGEFYQVGGPRIQGPGVPSTGFREMNPQLSPKAELNRCKGLVICYLMFFIILTISCQFYQGLVPWKHGPGLCYRAAGNVNQRTGSRGQSKSMYRFNNMLLDELYYSEHLV